MARPVVAGPPGVVYQPGQVPAQAQVAPDPVAMAVSRLSSHHDNSRRDGAITLGRLGDPRAVPALVNLLKNDRSKEVRAAAATALGEIGDPQSAIVLERAIIYDKKQDVRNAASVALSRMPRELPATSVPSAGAGGQPGVITSEPAATNSVPGLEAPESVPPPPTPAIVR